MKTFTTRDIFGIFVALGIGLCSLGAWRAFFVTTLFPDVRNTVVAFLWFLLLGTFFSLGTVVWKERFSQVVAPVLVFLPSFLFIHTWYHLVFVVCAALFAYLAIKLVQDEINDRVQFHFFRNVRAGSFTFILGLSLALSSAYYITIRAESWEELVPRFSIGQGTAMVGIKTIAYFYPEWKNLADEGITVDDFLLSLQKDTGGGEATSQPALDPAAFPGLAEYFKSSVIDVESYSGDEFSRALYLQAGRDQIAKLSGGTIRGDEKIEDVFSTAMQHKIITILNGEQVSQHLSPTIVPLVLAVLLFLTLLPVGTVMSVLWIALGFFFFRIGLFFAWLKLERIPKEQETLLP